MKNTIEKNVVHSLIGQDMYILDQEVRDSDFDSHMLLNLKKKESVGSVGQLYL